jgi:hypothetical protein
MEKETGICKIHGHWENHTETGKCPVCEYDKATRKETIKPYSDLTLEELNALLENPQDIETGCERHCDDCLKAEIGLIKEQIEQKKCPDHEEGHHFIECDGWPATCSCGKQENEF